MTRLTGRRRPEILRQERKGDTVVIDLRLNPELIFFEGHFPGRPMLPGVAFLHWVAMFAIEIFGPAPSPGGVPRLKFVRALLPGDEVSMTLRHRPERGRIDFTCTRDEQMCVQGTLAWAEGRA